MCSCRERAFYKAASSGLLEASCDDIEKALPERMNICGRTRPILDKYEGGKS